MKPENFMREAIRLSIENVESGTGGPFGAVITREGEIIARGTNRVTSSNDPTSHAEVVAIRAACESLQDYQLTDCEIYCSCEPCPMCLGAIYWARLGAIFYANTKADAAEIEFDDQFIYEELDREIPHRSLVTKQLLREEALAAFEKWAASETRIKY